MAKKITGITVKLGLDGSQVTSQLKGLDKAIAKSSSELREIDRALKFDPTNTELLAQKQEVLAQALEKSRERLQALEQLQNTAAKAAANNSEWEKAYEPLTKKIEQVTAELRELQKEKEAMDKKLESGEISQAEYDEYIAKLNEAKQAQKDLRKQKEQLDAQFAEGHITADEYRAYRRELEQVRAETARLEAETEQLDNATDRSSQAFRQAVQSTKQYQQAMDKLEKESAQFRTQMESALSDIWNLSLKVGGALASMAVTGVGASVKVGTSFDASMSNVEALSRAAGAELDALREKAQQMGASTSKSATEAADALGYMALAGWDTEQMLGGIEPILRASEAGAMDLATTSDLVTDSMSAMGVSVNDLNHYLDVATKAQSSSNTSLEQLLNAYVIAGGTFKNFNVSLEESSALLGILANRGIKGSEAGNSLNSVLINLIGASSTSANAMEELGISAYDADGNFIGISETLKLVSASMEGLDAKQRDLFTAKLGGKTQYDTLQALLSGVNEEYDELYGKLEQSNGALLETASIMQDNLKGDVTELTSALEDLGIQTNDNFTVALRDAVQVATKEVGKLAAEMKDGDVGESMQKIAESFGSAIKQIAKFAAEKGIPKTVEFFELVVDNGDIMISLIAGIGGAFAAWKIANVVGPAITAIQDFGGAVSSGIGVVKALNVALNANPWMLLATAVVAAGTAIATFVISSREAENELKKLNAENDKIIASAAAEATMVEHKANRYRELYEEYQKTGQASDELKRLAEELQMLSPDTIKLIDEETGAYKELDNSIQNVISSIRQKGIEEARTNSISAFQTNIADSYQNIYEAERDFYKNISHIPGEMVEELKKTDHGAYAKYYDLMETGGGDLTGEERDIYNKIVEYETYSQNLVEAKEAENKVIEENQKLIEETTKIYDGLIKAEKEASETTQQQMPHYSQDTVRRLREEADKKAKANEQAAETEIQTQEEILERLSESWEQAEHDYATGVIASEEELYRKKLQIWNSYGDKDLKEHWKYYEELYQTEQGFYQKQLDAQEEADKKRLEQQKTSLEEQVSAAENAVKDIESEYSDMISNINSQQNAYKNKLLDVANLFTSEMKQDKEGNEYELFTLENIDKQIKAIEEYDNKIKKLEARGAGTGLTEYIQGLSQEDAENVMHVLGTMSDKQLKTYSDKYDKLIDTVNQRAEERYAPQIEAVNAGFMEKIREVMGQLPEEMAKVGTDSIDGFIRGFSGKQNELVSSVSEYCNTLLSGFRDNLDIHSPSKETEALGEFAGEGFEKGLKKISGADAAAKFADEFIRTMAEKDTELRDVLYNAFVGNTANAISAMNAETSTAFKNLPYLQLPEIPTIKIPKAETEKATVSVKTDATPIITLLTELLDMMEIIINNISTISNREQVISADIPVTVPISLDGNVITQVVTRIQAEIRRQKGT